MDDQTKSMDVELQKAYDEVMEMDALEEKVDYLKRAYHDLNCLVARHEDRIEHLTVALRKIERLDCEEHFIRSEDRTRGHWCDGPCGEIAREALEVK